MRPSGSAAIGTMDERSICIVDSLPVDAADRVILIDALTAAHRLALRVADDGVFVTVEVRLVRDRDDLHEAILRFVGDVRCVSRDGSPVLEARFLRDGRRDPADLRIGPLDAWPEEAGDLAIDLAIDLDIGPPCPPERLAALLEMANEAAAAGRTVYFVNIPPHLRLFVETAESTGLVPIKREAVGPLLPDVLTDVGR